MADENNSGTSGVSSGLEQIDTGIQQITGSFSGSQSDTDKAKGTTDSAGTSVQNADEHAASASQQYAQAVNNLKNAYVSLHSDAREAAKTAKEADAEEQVAQVVANGGVVSISQALEFMEAEKEAKDAKHDAEAKLFQYTVKYAGEVVSSGAKVVAEQMTTGLQGIDSVFDVGSIATLVGGAAVGLTLSTDSTLGNIVTDAVDGYVDLKNNAELEEGVEEKTIDGMEDEAAYQAYMEANAGGEPTDPYLAENGGNGVYTGPDREPMASGYTASELSDSDDGLRISDEDLDFLTDPDRLAAEQEALAAQAAQAESGGLLDAIVNSDVAQAVVGAVIKNTVGEVPTEPVAEQAPAIPEVPEDDDIPDFGF